MDKTKKIIPLGVTIGGYDFVAPNVRFDFTTLDGVVDSVARLFDFAIGFSVIVAVVMIIYAGFLFMTSSGDPEKISTAGKALTAAFVGLVIVFLARTIIVFLLNEFLL